MCFVRPDVLLYCWVLRLWCSLVLLGCYLCVGCGCAFCVLCSALCVACCCMLFVVCLVGLRCWVGCWMFVRFVLCAAYIVLYACAVCMIRFLCVGRVECMQWLSSVRCVSPYICTKNTLMIFSSIYILVKCCIRVPCPVIRYHPPLSLSTSLKRPTMPGT